MDYEWPHSGLGIASFIMAMIVGLLMLATIAIAGAAAASHPHGFEQTPEAAAIGCGVIFAGILDLVAIGLAIGGLCQARRKKVFAVLGLIFSVLTVLGTMVLMLIGLAISQ